MLFEIKHRKTGEVLFSRDMPEGTPMRDVVRDAVLSEADLHGADLSGADLRGAHLRKAHLRKADLRRTDLTGADLRGAVLRWAVLQGAVLQGADLSGVDLRSLDIPVVPNLHMRILEAIRSGGTLEMSQWHGYGRACETTHCRAGWSIHLAGEAGYALENKVRSSVAGALIHVRSCPYLEGKVPDFHVGKAEALADIERCAELEAAGATCVGPAHCQDDQTTYLAGNDGSTLRFRDESGDYPSKTEEIMEQTMPELSDYQQRVVQEKAELDAKIKALKSFMSSSRWDKANPNQQRLLKFQLGAMQLYSDLLQSRIQDFEATAADQTQTNHGSSD